MRTSVRPPPPEQGSLGRARRSVASTSALCVLVLSTCPAARADETRACAAAAEEGQLLVIGGKLRSARDRFLVCTRAACPPLVKHDCDAWLSDAERRAPSVVISARDDAGQDLADVRVQLDGSPLVDKLDGRPMLLDAGEHTLRYEHKGSAPKEEKVVIRVGERDRPLRVTFERAAAQPTRGRSMAPFWIGVSATGVLVTGTVVTGVLALNAKADYDAKLNTFGVSHADIASARTQTTTYAIVNDVFLGATVVAAAVTTVLFFMRPTSEAEPKAASQLSFSRGGAQVAF